MLIGGYFSENQQTIVVYKVKNMSELLDQLRVRDHVETTKSCSRAVEEDRVMWLDFRSG